MYLSDLLEAAYRLFPPFMGLAPWKRRAPVSAFYHSLSTAAIAGDVARLLTDDQNEIDVATYGGLAHDYYQKAPVTINRIASGVSFGSYGKEEAREMLVTALSDVLDKDLLGDVLRVTSQDIAERALAGVHSYPAASIAMRIADLVASTESAVLVPETVRREISRLDEPGRKLLGEISLDVVSISLPQVALRSAMYAEVYRQVGSRAVLVLARDGLVVIRRADEQLSISIDIDKLKATSDEIEAVGEKMTSKPKKTETPPDSSEAEKDRPPSKLEVRFKSQYKPEVVTYGSGVEVELDESVKNALINVELVGVRYTSGSGYTCMLCGYPVPDPMHPGWYGYILYYSTNLERWSPRAPPLANLHTVFQGNTWLKRNLVLCPLCVLDAFAYKRTAGEKETVFMIQFYYPLPTHYEVAVKLAAIAWRVISVASKGFGYRRLVRLVEESLVNYRVFVDLVKEAEESMEHYGTGRPVLVDSTWATAVVPVSKAVSRGRGDVDANKEFAYFIPAIAMASYFTGLYPAGFSANVAPTPERGLISPVKPLYDFDPVEPGREPDVPLVLLTLAALSTMADELAEPGTAVDNADRAGVILDYLRHPFTMYTNILLNHSLGRKALDAYRSFRSSPLCYFKNYVSGRSPSPTT